YTDKERSRRMFNQQLVQVQLAIHLIVGRRGKACCHCTAIERELIARVFDPAVDCLNFADGDSNRLRRLPKFAASTRASRSLSLSATRHMISSILFYE